MTRDMDDSAVREFRKSDDTLRVYKGRRLLFTSKKERLLPLLEYIETRPPYEKDVTVLDRVVGNAAALLVTKISCVEVYGELGSELATETLRQFGISHRFADTVPYIENNRRDGMCPMEQLSIGKAPDEFYRALREWLRGSGGPERRGR